MKNHGSVFSLLALPLLLLLLSLSGCTEGDKPVTPELPEQNEQSSTGGPGDPMPALAHPDKNPPRKINIKGVVKNAVSLDSPVPLRPCSEKESFSAAIGVVPGSSAEKVDFRVSCGSRTVEYQQEPSGPQAWKNVSPSMCPCESGVRVSASPQAGAWLAHPCFQKPDKPRMVVFILIDALRADVLGAYGRTPSPSPQIDRMGRRGVVFERAYTASPFTLTSVASIFTGGYPWQHNVMFSEAGGLVLDDAVPKLVERFHEKGYHTAAFSGTYFFMSRNGYAEGFDHFDEACAGAFFRKSAECLNSRIIPWIEQHQGEDLFLYIHYVDPHAPYYPPKKFRKKYVGDMKKPFFDDVSLGEIGQFGSHRAWYQFWRSPSDYDIKYLHALYLSEVEYVDQKVGTLVKELSAGWRRSGREKGESVFLVTADHGEAFYEHGEMDHVADLHEPVMRVPLIMFGDGVPQGKTVTEQVRTIDFMPTLLALSGMEVRGQIPGRSLVPLMQGKEWQTEPAAAVHFLDLEPEYVMVAWPYKIFCRPEENEVELYNLEKDPGEKNDLADHNPEKRKEMQKLLQHLLLDLPEFGEKQKTEPVDEATRKRLDALGY